MRIKVHLIIFYYLYKNKYFIRHHGSSKYNISELEFESIFGTFCVHIKRLIDCIMELELNCFNIYLIAIAIDNGGRIYSNIIKTPH